MTTFAEEFAARRRKYIRLTSSDYTLISKDPSYKNFTFPFIRGGPPIRYETYPYLFSGTLEASFQAADYYIPATKFEAFSLELYKANFSGALEQVRKEAINSLLRSDILINLNALNPSLQPPTGPVPFGTQQSVSNEPSPSGRGYISPAFRRYLNTLIPSPATCTTVFFTENIAGDDYSIDMTKILDIFSEANLRTMCNTRPTIESVFRQLKNLSGPIIERYYRFLVFVFLFFDHIPQAQPAIDSLLKPLYGMIAGIINRGQWTPDEIAVLNNTNPNDLNKELTINYAEKISSGTLSAQEVFDNYKNMISYWYPSVTSALHMLVEPEGEITQSITGQPSPSFNVTKIDLKAAKAVYDAMAPEDFTFPSRVTGLFPQLLMSSPLQTAIFNLTAFKVRDVIEYNKLLNDLIDKDKNNEYSKLSRNRIGFIAPLAPVISGSIVGTKIKEIVPYPPGSTFISNPQDFTQIGRKMPQSWEEILYPALLQYLILPPRLSWLVSMISATKVLPCVQDTDYSIVFPSRFSLDDSAKVIVSSTANISDMQILASIYEFPCPLIEFSGANPSSRFGWAVTARGTKVIRGTIRSSGKSYNHILTNGLNVFDTVSNNGISFTSQATDITPYINEALTKRSKYCWTSLNAANQRFERNVFFPSFNASAFLNSFFDAKFQVFYIYSLVNMLTGRDDFAAERQLLLDLIKNVGFNPEVAAFYLRTNNLPFTDFGQFKNILFTVVGESVISGSLREIIKSPQFLKNSEISFKSRGVFRDRKTTRDFLYDLTLGDYIALFQARKVDISKLAQDQMVDAQRELKIDSLLAESKPLLLDPYSIALNDMLTRALI